MEYENNKENVTRRDTPQIITGTTGILKPEPIIKYQ